jgi:membrane protein DedA with SNARE-associated domain
MPYWKFLIANVCGGILWAGGTTAVIYYVGIVAEAWLKRFSWVGLVLAVAVGITSMVLMKRRAAKMTAAGPGTEPDAEKPAQDAAPVAGREPEPAAER